MDRSPEKRAIVVHRLSFSGRQSGKLVMDEEGFKRKQGWFHPAEKHEPRFVKIKGKGRPF